MNEVLLKNKLLLNISNFIKDHCLHFSDCSGCIFYCNGCTIYGEPSKWRLNDITED